MAIKQRALTLLATIKPAEIDSLRQTLVEIQAAIEAGQQDERALFPPLESVHFARCVILEQPVELGDSTLPTSLLIATNYDDDMTGDDGNDISSARMVTTSLTAVAEMIRWMAATATTPSLAAPAATRFSSCASRTATPPQPSTLPSTRRTRPPIMIRAGATAWT